MIKNLNQPKPEVILISILRWIQKWYEAQCNGDWEHSYGITIQTLDNPGWSLKICLLDTDYEIREFCPVESERSEDDWFHCRVKDGYFEGFGGPKNLEELFTIFKNWIEEH